MSRPEWVREHARAGWGRTTPAYRIGVLRELSAALRDREDLLVDTLVGEVGTPGALARSSHVGQALAVLDSYADLLETFDFEELIGSSRVLREPAGVVGAITPWNYPLYRPTVLTGVSPQSRIAQEEVFGPVLVVLPYADVDEAVGRVDLNGAAWNPSAPFGGYKQSGTGRELGRWGMEEFLEIKSIQVPGLQAPVAQHSSR